MCWTVYETSFKNWENQALIFFVVYYQVQLDKHFINMKSRYRLQQLSTWLTLTDSIQQNNLCQVYFAKNKQFTFF